MKLEEILIFTLILLGLSGCSFQIPTPEQLKTADFGTFPENYQSAIKKIYEKDLFDPYSAVYEFNSEPVKGYTIGAPIIGGKIKEYGYWVEFNINAKNRMGGYTGRDFKRVFIKNNEIRCINTIRPSDEEWQKLICPPNNFE